MQVFGLCLNSTFSSQHLLAPDYTHKALTLLSTKSNPKEVSPMEKAFGYLRVSSAGQAKDGYSLEEQYDRIVCYCQEQHLELIKIHEDAGICSAKVDEDGLTVDRPGIRALLGDLKDSGVQHVVVLTTHVSVFTL
jgi:hypothetical protein